MGLLNAGPTEIAKDDKTGINTYTGHVFSFDILEIRGPDALVMIYFVDGRGIMPLKPHFVDFQLTKRVTITTQRVIEIWEDEEEKEPPQKTGRKEEDGEYPYGDPYEKIISWELAEENKK